MESCSNMLRLVAKFIGFQHHQRTLIVLVYDGVLLVLVEVLQETLQPDQLLCGFRKGNELRLSS